MQKFLLLGCVLTAAPAFAQSTDSKPRDMRVGEAQVVSNRATSRTPIAYSNVGKEEIEARNFGQDIPMLLSTLPGVVATSDAGNGIGYTAFRVRGTDASRINITANGIPLNDAESQAVFWVNMGDFASSLQDLQLQRGVGTSTNGAGAFGASLNMLTARTSNKPFGEVNASFGSFDTYKATLKGGTGVMKNGWALDGRLSHLQSDGYRDRAWAKLNSYFAQATHYSGATMFKLLAFGGKEQTYHAWHGISREQLKTNRTFNPNGEIKKGVYYPNQTDNYFQQHAQALLTHQFSNELSFSGALHYTYGTGYYEEYKKNRKLKEYNIPTFELNGEAQKKADLVREKHLLNHFFGGNWAMHYNTQRWDLVGGLALNHYIGHHFGHVNWVKDAPMQPSKHHEYYRNLGLKTDENLFLRANYKVGGGLSLYTDLQYRFIDYSIEGTSDKKPVLDVEKNFHFFNPKVGLTYRPSRHHTLYASVAMAHREPARNSYTEAFAMHEPKAERLIDAEWGYKFRSGHWMAGVNAYYMHYKDQLVPNGRKNEIGEDILENVPTSFRSGVEFEAAWTPCRHFSWGTNVSLSENKIKDYTAYLYDGDHKEYALPMGETTISFSPSLTANNVFTLRPIRNLDIALTTQYVGRQYLDNMQMEANSLDPYCVSHLTAGYTFAVAGKSVKLTAAVYNVFDHEYEVNGYAWSYIADPATKSIGSGSAYYPMAGRNFLLNLSVKF